MLLTKAGAMDSYVQFVTVLLMFLFVLGITYVVTRWIAGYQKGKIAGGNVEILECVQIAQNKYIQIVRIGKRYLAIAVCKEQVTMLTELNEDELVLEYGEKGLQESFQNIMKKYKQKNILEKDNDLNSKK